MANSSDCVVLLLFFFAFWLAPQRQALAVQSSSSVVFVETAEWQPSSADLTLSGDNAGSDRGNGLLIGAAAGGALGFLVSERYRFLGPDQSTHVLAGAVFGAIAGFIISGPSPEESSERQLGSSVRAYIPAQGGLGLAVDL